MVSVIVGGVGFLRGTQETTLDRCSLDDWIRTGAGPTQVPDCSKESKERETHLCGAVLPRKLVPEEAPPFHDSSLSLPAPPNCSPRTLTGAKTLAFRDRQTQVCLPALPLRDGG